MTDIGFEAQRFDAAMRRALELAALGPARGVNPQVGCVILSPAGDVLSEGWHRGAGTAHAEVDALSKLTPEQASGATAVVSLEPCNHTGRTGPCSEALIAAGVARVVYAVDDPGHASHGGAKRLREAGVEVISGVEADAASRLLQDWLVAARLGRPHVTLKWATLFNEAGAAFFGMSAAELKHKFETNNEEVSRIIQSRLNVPVIARLKVREETYGGGDAFGADGAQQQRERIRITVSDLKPVFEDKAVAVAELTNLINEINAYVRAN